MGYVVTKAKSPDAELISACARYVAGEDDGGLMRDIARMSAMSPEGWRALAEAADHASETENALEAAELVFVMQRSLLGKRKHIREPEPRFVGPETAHQTITAKIALNIRQDASMNELTTADIAESWCTGTLAASGRVLGVETLSGLAAKIRERQATAKGIDAVLMPAATYGLAMASLAAPGSGRLVATA